MSDTKRRTEVSGKTVNVLRWTKPDARSEAVACNWTFDYSDCTQQELLELATAEMVIRQQRLWREASAAERLNITDYKIDVHEMINTPRERGPIVPTVKSTAKHADKLSKDDKLALIEQIRKSLESE